MFKWNDGTELYHYGIKGQKKGLRRFQYEDGSLTPAGRERYGVGDGQRSQRSSSQDRFHSRKKGYGFGNAQGVNSGASVGNHRVDPDGPYVHWTGDVSETAKSDLEYYNALYKELNSISDEEFNEWARKYMVSDAATAVDLGNLSRQDLLNHVKNMVKIIGESLASSSNYMPGQFDRDKYVEEGASRAQDANDKLRKKMYIRSQAKRGQTSKGSTKYEVK